MSDCHDMRTISNSEYGSAVKCLTGTKTCSRKEILHKARTTISYWTEQLFWSVRMGGRVANVVTHHDKLLTQ